MAVNHPSITNGLYLKVEYRYSMMLQRPITLQHTSNTKSKFHIDVLIECLTRRRRMWGRKSHRFFKFLYQLDETMLLTLQTISMFHVHSLHPYAKKSRVLPRCTRVNFSSS